MDDLQIRTITHVVDRLRSVGASITHLSGRMAQCPYMGEQPLPYLFAEALAEQARLAEALDAYKRITEPREAPAHIDEIEDGIVRFGKYQKQKRDCEVM